MIKAEYILLSAQIPTCNECPGIYVDMSGHMITTDGYTMGVFNTGTPMPWAFRIMPNKEMTKACRKDTNGYVNGSHILSANGDILYTFVEGDIVVATDEYNWKKPFEVLNMAWLVPGAMDTKYFSPFHFKTRCCNSINWYCVDDKYPMYALLRGYPEFIGVFAPTKSYLRDEDTDEGGEELQPLLIPEWARLLCPGM